MKELLLRFFIGGVVVSSFALLGDLLKPKRFAGLFGAAPSIALATLSLTIATDGRQYAATESRSMIAGAVAFFIYASCVCWILMRFKPPALRVALTSMVIWLGAAFGLWFVILR